MKVRFWGTRGSIPTPGPSTLRYGGNTSCVELRTDNGTLLILDCGTGLRELGASLHPSDVRGHIFLSHTHWDHIQGFPFFMPAFMPGNRFDIYAAKEIDKRLADVLAGQMEYQYFPVTLDRMESRIHFNELREGCFQLDDVKVTVQYLNHTSLCLGYRFEAEGRTVCYCTDVEPNARVFLRSDAREEAFATDDVERALRAIVHDEDRRYARFVLGADLVIHDAMYTAEEYVNKVGWGHSSGEFATDLAMLTRVRRLALYHHEPVHSDAELDQMVETCRRRASARSSPLEVIGAAEGLELTL
jgi:phosphoribosyl 1,2-cyclic phosphodiesterase